MIDSVSSPSQLLFCFWTGRCWANKVTRARVYHAAPLGMRLYRPPQQHAMRAYSYSPRRQAYQTALHGTTCLLSRGQGRQNDLPVLFLGEHGDLNPCLLPKRPPSRQGKVGSNLVSILRLRSASICPGSLTYRARSSTQNRNRKERLVRLTHLW